MKRTEILKLKNRFFGAIILTLLVLMVIPSAYSQSPKIKKLEIALEKTAKKSKTVVLYQLSEAYLKTNILKSKEYAKEALRLAKKYDNVEYEANSLNILGVINYNTGHYADASKYFVKELDIREKSSKDIDIAFSLYNIATINLKDGNIRKATDFYEKSLKLVQKVGDRDLAMKCSQALFGIYYERAKYKQAINYFIDYVEAKDSTLNVRTKQKMSVLSKKVDDEQFALALAITELENTDSTLVEVNKQKEIIEKESEKKDEEIEVLNYENAYKEKEIENQQLKNNLLLVFILFLLVIAILIYRGYLARKRANVKLREQNAQILQQKEEIEAQAENLSQLNGELFNTNLAVEAKNEELFLAKEKVEKSHKNITDSINYASRIQKALLPTQDIIGGSLNKHFIIFKPRDVVSGDFYWFKKIDNKIVIIAADSTGHGVPGAFVSMLGISLLNQIITNPKETTGEILDELRGMVKKSLHQTGKEMEQKDGMDLALCIIDTETKVMEYSGAHNPLYVIRKVDETVELLETKATRNPIGIYLREIPFKTNQIQLYNGDKFYIFSDGFVDQFGGEKGAKFKTKNFKKLLVSSYDKNMDEQKKLLELQLNEWQADKYEQVDDILVIGVEI